MPSNVEAAFNAFLLTLRTTPTEASAAAGHRISIEAKLKAEFGMTSFFRTGSFGNGTNVSGHSDVDYFAVIPRSNLLANSAPSLAAVAEALRERFPQTPNIRVDSPGVRVPFGLDGAEATEIVPVNETGRTLLNFRAFDMPDGNGAWKFSAPDSHNAYVSGIDDSLGGRVKPLIKLIKAWKFKRNVPIKSFYIELRVAHYASYESTIVYDIDVANVLELMLAEQLNDFPDPRFVERFPISACNTLAQRQDALSKLENAASWARAARIMSSQSREREAIERWQLVFNYAFPAFAA